MIDLILVECPNLALENPKMYFSLGNLYLFSAVRKAGFNVRLLDFRAGVGEIPQAKFYGFSCTTPQIKIAKQLAKQVSGKTIVGGAHASLLPDDCVGDFDYIVKGEGEETLVNILKGSEKEGIISSPRIENLDTLCFPAWDSVHEPFSNTLYSGERYGEGEFSMAVITSRGCRWLCHYCGNIYHKTKFRSVNNIIGELNELMSRNIYHFRFVDDNFTLFPELFELCKQLGQLKINYRCHTRSDLITSNKAKALKDSGCEECSLGIESADPFVLKLNNKKETVEAHHRAIQLLKDAKIKIKFSFTV